MKPFYFFLCAMICSSLSGMESELEPEPVRNVKHTWWLFGRPDPAHVQTIPVATRVENNWLPQPAPVSASVVVALFPPLGDVVFDIEAEHNARLAQALDARHVICRIRNPNYRPTQQASREKTK